MSRLFLVAAGLMLLVPALSSAQPGPLPGANKPLSPSQYGEAKPAKCSTCPYSSVIQAQALVYYPGQGSYGARLQSQVWGENHECSPDGCPKPLGCGNFWTEKKFIFGSCRQFFGTAGATTGIHRNAVELP